MAHAFTRFRYGIPLFHVSHCLIKPDQDLSNWKMAHLTIFVRPQSLAPHAKISKFGTPVDRNCKLNINQ